MMRMIVTRKKRRQLSIRILISRKTLVEMSMSVSKMPKRG
jgi:hypothetical protein